VEEASPPGSAKFMDRLIIRGVYGRVRWRNNGVLVEDCLGWGCVERGISRQLPHLWMYLCFGTLRLRISNKLGSRIVVVAVRNHLFYSFPIPAT
jgi:hypothetical protein